MISVGRNADDNFIDVRYLFYNLLGYILYLCEWCNRCSDTKNILPIIFHHNNVINRKGIKVIIAPLIVRRSISENRWPINHKFISILMQSVPKLQQKIFVPIVLLWCPV